MTIYLSAAKRTQVIDQYMECWHDTESYSSRDKADEEAAEMRAFLVALPNPKLYEEVKSNGWLYQGVPIL
jgi:hypothetical protein